MAQPLRRSNRGFPLALGQKAISLAEDQMKSLA